MRSHSPLARAVIHASLGVIIVLAVFILGKDLVAALLAAAATVFFVAEWFRFRSQVFNRWLMTQFVVFVREEEVRQLTGATYYLVGTGLTIAFFPVHVAVTAVLFLALGDPIATLVGKSWGKRQFWRKSLEGNLACLVVCLVIGMLSALIQTEMLMAVAVTGAVFAFIFEMLPWPVNDNLTIPVGTAAAMLVLKGLLQM